MGEESGQVKQGLEKCGFYRKQRAGVVLEDKVKSILHSFFPSREALQHM